MAEKSLLFIPDISGFTQFVQSTEVAHSEHVIAELLEILISANTQSLQLAEVEGDALFFYKEGQIPSQEKLLAQIETMYSAFYSHLKMMETHRICPCNACATAPDLELKIVMHAGDLQFITVQGQRKPFGETVIQAHRLLKNSIKSDNYALISSSLAKEIGLSPSYKSKLFDFHQGSETYDGQEVPFLYAEMEVQNLNLFGFEPPKKVDINRPPNFIIEREININAHELLEFITNYRYRHTWVEGVDEFQFNENEVTRAGTEHVCVINGKHFNFTTVVKEVSKNQLVYGEHTEDPPPVDKVYQFYIIEAIDENRALLRVELYWFTRTILQKFLMATLGKRTIIKGLKTSVSRLQELMENGAAPYFE